jgi:glycosyltransferase involved in cell wall biosynthesis
VDQIQKAAYKPILLKKISKIAHLNICINTQSIALLKSYSIKCRYLPNFISESQNAIKQYNEKVTSILFVGHALTSKGLLEIIRTAQHFNEIEFIIIGPFNKKIKSISPNNIKFIGELTREQISVYYNLADIFLFPSHSEGFANVILEAMDHALPIITTDVGANKEILEDKGALFCKVGSYEDIVKAFNELAKREKRKRMGEWNKTKVKIYHQGMILPGLLSIYLELKNND